MATRKATPRTKSTPPAPKAKPSTKTSAQAAAQSAAKPAAKTKPAPKPAPAHAKPAGEALLAVGASAPDFNLKADDGSAVTLSSLRGKSVVLYFYPKDSTPGCTQEACDFRDNLARVKAKGALVFGVSADSVESHRRFKDKQGLNFPLLSDPDKKTIQAYRVWQEKTLYGRKFMGIVRTTYVINGQGKIAHVFPKVKVAGHADEVLSVL